MEANKLKAVFVGIGYGDKVSGCPDLEERPYKCVNKIVLAMTSDTGSQVTYKKEQCLLLVDTDKTGIDGIRKDSPSKTKVMKSLVDLISAAQEGDSLLFYYCGHARRVQEKGKSCSVLVTLNDTLNAPDVIFSNELDDILKTLPPHASISILVHAGGTGTAFTYHPTSVSGVVLVSVGPLCPLMVTRGYSIVDFCHL